MGRITINGSIAQFCAKISVPIALWEDEIRQNIVNLAFRADEMDNMMVERFGCEFSEYAKAEA